MQLSVHEIVTFCIANRKYFSVYWISDTEQMCLYSYLGYMSFTEICGAIHFYNCFKNTFLCVTRYMYKFHFGAPESVNFVKGCLGIRS
jgi:hypothetical protein